MKIEQLFELCKKIQANEVETSVEVSIKYSFKDGSYCVTIAAGGVAEYFYSVNPMTPYLLDLLNEHGVKLL